MKRSRPRRKSPKRKEKQELDLMLKQLLLRQRGEKCELEGFGSCGFQGNSLEAAHIIAKGPYPSMRYVPENLLLLCYRHHHHFAHKCPVEFVEAMQKKWPGRVDVLRMSAQMPRKVDLKEVRSWLDAELKKWDAGSEVTGIYSRG